MQYKELIENRYPKGKFAMFSVYSLTFAAIVASTVFSLLLFLSIDDNPMMKTLFGALAIIFEAGKFYAWYEYGERRAHGNFTGAAAAMGFYLVLAAISIGGSIGGINSATNTAQGHIAIEQAKIATYDRQIEAIEKQIELNNLAAQKYIEMERIATGVKQIQLQNNKLREEQQQIAVERDSLPPVAQGSVIGLIDSLASAFGVSTQQAQLALVVFLSFLLDFFAAFFVGVIGEEQRFRHYCRRFGKITIDGVATPVSPAFLPNIQAPMDENHEPEEQQPEPALTFEEKVMQALEKSTIPCSKKAVAKHFSANSEDVDKLFSEFMEKGLLAKKANNHYYWAETEAAA